MKITRFGKFVHCFPPLRLETGPVAGARLMLLWLMAGMALTFPAFAQTPPPGSGPGGQVGHGQNAGASSQPRCDGTSDDAPAINALLRNLDGVGGVVQLPKGKCLIRSPLLIPSRVTLAGQGMGATILQGAPAEGRPEVDFPLVRLGQFGDPPVVSNNSVVRDLTSDGGAVKKSPKRQSGSVIVAPNSTGNKVLRVEARNAGDNGIESDGIGTEIAFNNVHDNWTNGIYVIGYFAPKSGTVIRASGVTIHDNHVFRNSIANRNAAGDWLGTNPSWDGIDVDPMTENCTIEKNLVEGNDIILYETGAHVDKRIGSYGHKIINNTVKNSPENGIDISGYVYKSQVINNKLSNTVGWGIFLNSTGGGNVIQQNVIHGATKGGTLLVNQGKYDGVPRDWVFAGNEFVNVGSAITPGSGIELRAGENITIRGGQIQDNRPRPVMRYAIDTAGAGSGVQVINVALCPGALGVMRNKPGDVYQSIQKCPAR